jgi:hypothetical protein
MKHKQEVLIAIGEQVVRTMVEGAHDCKTAHEVGQIGGLLTTWLELYPALFENAKFFAGL